MRWRQMPQFCNTLAGVQYTAWAGAIGLALPVSVAAVCIGAGDFEQARYYTKKPMLIAVISIAALSVVLIGFSPWIMKVYHLSPETEQLAIQVIRYHAVLAMLIWVYLLYIAQYSEGSR